MSIEYIFSASNNKLEVFDMYLCSRSLIGQILSGNISFKIQYRHFY